jgi:transforming growth factor-beta-induced protein
LKLCPLSAERIITVVEIPKLNHTMKSFLLIIAALCFFVAAASAQTIPQVLAQQPLYTQLNASLVGKPIETFLNDANITATLLAPIDQKTPLNLTDAQISYHVINGTALNAANVQDGELFVTSLSLASLNNGFQRIRASRAVNTTQVFLGPNRASLNNTALTASNGVIHGLDQPMALPVDLATLTTSVDVLRTLSTFLAAANIQLNNSIAGVTAFAPNDNAFKALQTTSPLVYNYLTVAAGLQDLSAVLQLHVARSVAYSNELSNETIPTLNGEDLTITVEGSTVRVGNSASSATVVSADNLASNGVAHIIDQVLIPTDFKFNLRKALLGLKLNTFTNALASLNLTQYLDNTDPFTIFAPTDAALAGKNATADLLKYHIIAESQTIFVNGLLPSQLALASSNQAFQQLKFQVDTVNNITTVNGVTLGAAQNVGASGVIYVLDTVLTPPSKSIVQTAVDGGFSRLVSAVTYAGVAAALQGTTVFAPNNAAFTGPIADYLLLNTTQSNADLINVLKLHVVNGSDIFYINGQPPLPGTVVTLNGDITVTTVNTTVVLNGNSKVVGPNILAANGVIHAIDTVLLPSDFAITTDKVVKGYKASDFLTRLGEANLTSVLTGTGPYTIFAFTDAAYDSAPKSLTSNPSKWPTVMKTHVFNGTIASLVAGRNYTMLSGEILQVASPTSVQVVGAESAGKPSVLGGPIVSDNGVVYLIDGILSVKAVESDDGLSDTAIGFIVIGCIIGVLLIIGAAGGGYWYYRRRAGYEQIGDNSF